MSAPSLSARDAWARAEAAVWLLAVDPRGLGGLWLRARSSPQRDRVTAALSAAPLTVRRLHPQIADDALFGGVDLGATLAAGRTVRGAGMLAAPALLTLPMAERCPPGLAARLAQALDGGAQALVAIDESAGDDEALPGTLVDRLGLFVDLGDVAWGDCAEIAPDAEVLAAARARLPTVAVPDEALAAMTLAAACMGIGSLRAPWLALAAARAAAALRGADMVADADLDLAAALVLAHRGIPPAEGEAPEEEADRPDAPPPGRPEEGDSDAEAPGPAPEEVLIAAARASLPPEVLSQLAAGRAARAAAGNAGSGGHVRGNRRGRPLPSRPGRIGGGARVDLVATLRAAAPWQPLRRAQAGGARGEARLFIRPGDVRVKRYQDRSDRVLIFAVDASGSAAFARLGEAKGAVELLLAAAYARRDHVALIAFRGTGAEVLLPPTRSLVQTKRRLAALPGGGGTPLAAGLQAGAALAAQARARGMTPTLALLTDGRGNIALDGTPGRARAGEDAVRMARSLAASGCAAVVIDTGARPQLALAELARQMGAPCLALPRADARGLATALQASMAPAG